MVATENPTQVDIANLSQEQINELIRRRQNELRELRRASKGQTTADGAKGSLNKVLSSANAQARANAAFQKAQNRLNETNEAYNAAVDAYLKRYNIDELPTDVVQRIEASQATAVANMEAAHERIRAKLKGRTASSSDADTEDDEA